jgi:hypothetical protein
MTVAMLTFHLAGAGWTIASPDGKFKIDAQKACIDASCKPTGEVKVDERGIWTLASMDAELRWASPETVEIRTATGTWVPADFRRSAEGGAAPERLPSTALVDEVTRWDRGVLPGLWTMGTAACAPGTVAWHYQPILAELPALGVAEGKPVAKGARTEPCKDAPGKMGVYPAE